jgi:RimJ/RimL family protein N-acetyltransferase
MTADRDVLTASPLATPRLTLEPLRVEHAAQMAVALNDPALHTFIGGEPAGLDELRRRYTAQVRGVSADGRESWLNWVARRDDDGRAIGFVQATVTGSADARTAEVAWVIGVPDQGRGYAAEATAEMLRWLHEHGVATVVAHIHPDHLASAAIARRLGLRPTADMVDGEVRWLG